MRVSTLLPVGRHIAGFSQACGRAFMHAWQSMLCPQPWVSHTCRQELRQRFPDKPWLDVLSKADLLEEELDEADQLMATAAAGQGKQQQQAANAVLGSHAPPSQHPVSTAVQFAAALPAALRVSSTSGVGIAELKLGMLQMLTSNKDLESVA